MAPRAFSQCFAMLVFSLPGGGFREVFQTSALSTGCFSIVAFRLLCFNCHFAIVVLLQLSCCSCRFAIVVLQLSLCNFRLHLLFCNCCVSIVVLQLSCCTFRFAFVVLQFLFCKRRFAIVVLQIQKALQTKSPRSPKRRKAQEVLRGEKPKKS